jgi:hypothetical protein
VHICNVKPDLVPDPHPDSLLVPHPVPLPHPVPGSASSSGSASGSGSAYGFVLVLHLVPEPDPAPDPTPGLDLVLVQDPKLDQLVRGFNLSKSESGQKSFFLYFFFCAPGHIIQYFPVQALYPEPCTLPYEIRIYRYSSVLRALTAGQFRPTRPATALGEGLLYNLF